MDLPPRFGSCDLGQRLSLVARLQCWDFDHEAHLLVSVHEGTNFLASGLLEGTGDTFTLLNVVFQKQFPVPVLVIDEHSHVFRHDRPSWSSMHDVIELCAGFGGMHQGMSVMGFRPTVAVDFNDRFLKLYGQQCDAHLVCGDVNHFSTVEQIWKASKGAGTLVAGFACQPYSKLGDQLGGQDPRSLCLRGILSTAFYLQVHAVVLECVQPAAENAFVKDEIQRFLDASGFHMSQCELSLQDVWPARRHRAWWLLTSPFLGKIQLEVWQKVSALTCVRHIIPALQPWDVGDEDELALNESERCAFGVENDSFHRYMLNFETCAPCALHSWGSQVVACKCGCRAFGLSEKRLREKGLFGCIVRSCPSETKPSILRHVHPNEVMMMCGYDPIVDFGPNPRLTLAAAGQMASPLQAAWVFAALEERIQKLRGSPTLFKADAQIQAFSAWLLMRGRQVWQSDVEPIHDPKTLALMQFWNDVSHLSMPELMHPTRWPELDPCTVSVASVLDLLIRRQQANQVLQVVPKAESPEDVPMTVIDDDTNELAPTPWPAQLPPEQVLHPTSQEGCVVIFQHELANPFVIKVSAEVTIQQLIDAQKRLVGPFRTIEVCDHEGKHLPMSLILQVGQTVYIKCDEASDTSVPDPLVDDLKDCAVSFHACPDGEPPLPMDLMHNLADDPIVTPTASWTVPAAEGPEPVNGHFGPFDAGECPTPTVRLPDCEAWISAAPLLGLSGQQFLNLHVPCVQSTTHLWSLKHQFVQSCDRAAILRAQDAIWSDDEFRHHIGLLLDMRTAQRFSSVVSPERNCMMLDPLLLTGWVQHGTRLCHLWAETHPEIFADGVIILSACVLDGHWIPVVLTPNGDSLHFSTWDLPAHSHEKLNEVIEALGKMLGFKHVSILRHQRMFFSSDKCGALAMSFLHHSVFSSMLPTCNDEADMVHSRLRMVYLQAVEACQIARRPWVWGAGDNGGDFFQNEPGQSSADVPSGPSSCPEAVGGFSHQCIDKDARISLLSEKGKMWGDDEIRFHLSHMLQHPRNVANDRFSPIPGFVMMDPLLLSTWDSIGKQLCEVWCRRHMVVPDAGFHVVAIFLHQDHWFPVWIVPHGRAIVAHVLEDGVVDHQIATPLFEVLRDQFGFQELVVNKHPQYLPDHNLCGAAAVAFIGHIMVSAPLPQDLDALSDCHSNMKAAFVQALFEGKCCICPVAWGAGSNAGLVKSLASELAKHGVPEGLSEKRAQQAIHAIGADPVQQALSSKNVWRSLKAVGNNVKFQFLLPDELAAVVSNNKSLPVGKRLKIPAPAARPSLPEVVDPVKLALPEGVFHADGQSVPQISVKQLGPLAFGVVLISYDEALPYLKAGKMVSNDPLAMVVFKPVGVELETALPHTTVMIPCVCIANNEPLLTEAVVVQIGQGFVEKRVIPTAITLDQLEVATVKIMVYRDEYLMSWDDFVTAPIKHLVKLFPTLTRCSVTDCKCDHWHNPEQLPLRDPIMDVWRRQFLRAGFKPVTAAKSEIFSVCLRVPMVILKSLLAQSGVSGAYTEPRTPDGKRCCQLLW